MPVAEKKTKIMITVDRSDLADLSELCDNYRNLSPNQVLALAAGELAKLKGRKDDNLFNALSRISDDPTTQKKPALSAGRSHAA
jgi:hypothetical protein